MLRALLLASALCGSGFALAAQAQEFAIPEATYPTLPSEAASAQGFAPPGWRVETEATGDLNVDRAADLAFVLRMDDPANILRHEGLGANPFDSNPRIFGVALATAGGGYRLVVQNRDLIPRPVEPTQEDPYSGLEITRDAVKVTLARMMNAGGWDAGTTAFTFRWRGEALRLIDFDYFNAHRGSGESSSLGVNYLTRRVRIATGNIASNRERVRWSRLGQGPAPTIEEIGDGLEFDPEGLIGRLP